MLHHHPFSNILVVDDQPEVRRELAELLRRDGHAVREASGLRDALGCLRGTRYDVVLTNAILATATSQLELLSRIKADWPETRVILFTDRGTVDDAVLAMKGGAYDYVEMPVDPQRIARMLRSAPGGSGDDPSHTSGASAAGHARVDKLLAMTVDPRTPLTTIDRIAASTDWRC